MLPLSEPAPDIDIVSPDLSGNVMGRAMVFADLLLPDMRVRVLGPASRSLWHPIEGRGDIRIEDTGPVTWRGIVTTARAIKAPVVLALKPLATSLGAALLSRRGRHVILDIDDPEAALLSTNWRALLATAPGPLGLIPTQLASGLVHRADAITVAGGELQRRYGGTVIPHARADPFARDPVLHDRELVRAALGLERGTLFAVYVGTIRRHKGIEMLAAIARAVTPARVYVVGASSPRSVPEGVVPVPPVDFATALRWVAAADVVLVPQRAGRVSAAQVPAKVSDALAVGRALVASDVGPIREVVGDAAILVRAGRADLLAEATLRVLQDSRLREQLETRARQRFEERLSVAAVRPRLLKVIAATSGRGPGSIHQLTGNRSV